MIFIIKASDHHQCVMQGTNRYLLLRLTLIVMKNFAVACDFSHPAISGVDYAAQLASRLQRMITLVYVMQGVDPEIIEIKPTLEDAAGRENCLRTIASEISREYHLYCGTRLELTLETLEDTLATLSSPYELLIMGTNGAENYYQHFFGSNTFQVMQRAKCPVLMVPEMVRYRTIKRIVYAYHPETNPLFLIDQLRNFTTAIEARLTVLHIATEPRTDDTEEKLLALRAAVLARSTSKLPLSFEFRFAKKDGVATALRKFMKDEDYDVMAVSVHHRTIMDELMREDVLKNLSRLADFPVLAWTPS